MYKKWFPNEDPNEIRLDIDELMRDSPELLKIPLMPGAIEILSYFRTKGLKIALASSNNIERINRNLKCHNIEQYFDVVMSGRYLQNPKPAPDVFINTAEQLQLAPMQCYVFEDSYNGVRAGHSAGCLTIMIPDMLAPNEEMEKTADYIFQNLTDALNYFKSTD